MSEVRWQIELTADPDHQRELLEEGWEPFSAFLNVGRVVAFRRHVGGVAELGTEQARRRALDTLKMLYLTDDPGEYRAWREDDIALVGSLQLLSLEVLAWHDVTPSTSEQAQLLRARLREELARV